MYVITPIQYFILNLFDLILLFFFFSLFNSGPPYMLINFTLYI